jgi:hypothetical protein
VEWQIMVNATLALAVRASWIVCVIAAALAWTGFDASRHNAKPCCHTLAPKNGH